MQRERLVTGQLGGPLGLGPADRGVQDGGAGREGAPEGVLLGVGDLADPAEHRLQLGVGLGHRLQADREQLGQRRVLHAEQPHGADRAAQQAAQDVAAALVARGHPVAHQHQSGPDVVGDHPEPDVVAVVGPVVPPGQLLGGGDDRVDLVDLVEVVHPLEQVGHPLQAHPGVDVLVGQLTGDVEVHLGADRGELLLHEDQVPDLQEPVLVDHGAAVGAVLRTPVDVDLAAGATGARDPHVPVVVLPAAPLDPLLREPGHPVPDVGRLVVPLQHGHPDGVRVEPEEPVVLGAGDQLPGVGDRPLLEVVAEGEVAVHLEEGAVPGGLADLLDVQGPHALLHRGRPGPGRGLLPEEVGLEGHHPRVHEQQVGVVVQQRRTRHHRVALALEEGQPATADLGGFHELLMHESGSGHSNRRIPRPG